MSKRSYSETLLGLIERLLRGEYAVPAFNSAYTDFYLEKQPDRALSLPQAELFASVQQKLDWTDENPTPRSRQDGWQDYQQFLAWIQRRYEDYLLQEACAQD